MEAEDAYREVLQLQPDCQEAKQGLAEIERRNQEVNNNILYTRSK